MTLLKQQPFDIVEIKDQLCYTVFRVADLSSAFLKYSSRISFDKIYEFLCRKTGIYYDKNQNKICSKSYRKNACRKSQNSALCLPDCKA